MKVPLYGVILLTWLLSLELIQAKKNDDSLASMAYGSSDVSDYDYDDTDDNDDIDSMEKELVNWPLGKRRNAPTGVWRKRMKLSDSRRTPPIPPPGIWGKISSSQKERSYKKRGAGAS